MYTDILRASMNTDHIYVSEFILCGFEGKSPVKSRLSPFDWRGLKCFALAKGKFSQNMTLIKASHGVEKDLFFRKYAPKGLIQINLRLNSTTLHQISPKRSGFKGHAHTMGLLNYRFRLEQRHGTKNCAWKPAQKDWE